MMLASAFVALAPMAFGQTPPAEAPEPKPADAPVSAEAPAAKPAAPMGQAKATVITPEGITVGSVSIADTASGMMHVTMALTGVAPGTKAVHIHTTGKCEGPKFESAGGHLTGGHDHGIDMAAGPHAGDMPNIHVPESGALTVEDFVPGVTVAEVMDSDGGALVIHAGADDYTSQPAGDAGGRIACGVFVPGA